MHLGKNLHMLSYGWKKKENIDMGRNSSTGSCYT